MSDRRSLDDWMKRAQELIEELGVEKAQAHPDLAIPNELIEEFPEL